MPDVAPPRDPIFDCAGEMATRCASFDWSTTTLGLPSTWPGSLRTVVAMTLRNAFPMVVTWGHDFVMVYNDAYIAALGDKHPGALGSTLPEQFCEIWPDIERAQTAVLHGAETYSDEDVPFVLERHGGPETTYYTFSWSHVPPDEPDAGPGGVLTVLSDRTAEVVGARRLQLLNDLRGRVEGLTDPTAAMSVCGEVLAGASDDLVAATFFRPDDTQSLTSASSTSEDGPPPEVVRCWTDDDVVVSTHGPPRVALPVRARGQVAAVLLLVPHPLRLLDEDHLRWLGLVGEQVSQALSAATARADEQDRRAAMAQIDALKSDFLSNISHEFRTPLTLVLGPLHDLLATPGSSLSRQQAEAMHRSGRRLLRLVESLMDVARMDGSAGSDAPAAEPVDLTALTRDLVLPFEPPAVQAGLVLATHLEETGALALAPALWETIVNNLLANAIKYTPSGLVEVALTVETDEVVLRVHDSGVGIPESEHQRIFERFQRVLGPESVSVEGTGLGLALVADAARALDGSVTVASRPEGGSVFTVRVPRTQASSDQPPVRRPTQGAHVLAEDLAATLPHATEASATDRPAPAASPPQADLPTVLVVDDNPDMRQHVAGVLAPLGQVVACGDGVEALEHVGSTRVDLVVTDVSMPRLDGLGLVERLRSDPRHAAVPVVVLSARAGPEAAVSALQLGADDYVVKPFSSTDLLARCRTTLELARMRADHASAGARDAVLAGVSHEMQTPLSVVMTALDLIALPDLDDLTRAEAARRAAARIRVLDRLVRQFLDWSRISTGSPIVALRSPVGLDELLDAVLLEHPRVEVVGAGLETRPVVSCDIRRTEQILHTLLTGAAGSTESRVEVEVVAQRGADDDVVAYDVVVRDDGPAVDESALRGLVTPTLMDGTPSTGAIGLAVSRAVARAQAGDLTLGSMDQHGNVFVLRLAAVN